MTMYCPYLSERSAQGRHGECWSWTRCQGSDCAVWDFESNRCLRAVEKKTRIKALTADTNSLEKAIREQTETLKGVIEKMSYYGELMEHGQGYEEDQRERALRALESEDLEKERIADWDRAEAEAEAEREEYREEEERAEERRQERVREEQAPRASHNLRTDGGGEE